MRIKQSSLDFYAFVSVYGQGFAGSFIKKIHQVGAKDFIFQIYRSDLKRRNLYVSLERGIAFMDFPTEPEPGQIAITLRKMLSERKIESIRQVNFDRVIVIKLVTGQEIIFEMFREGNLVVTNGGIIEFAFNAREWKNRKIMKGEKYVPPSSINPLEMDQKQLKDVLFTSKASLVQTLATRMNLGGDLAEEICFRAGVDKSIPAANALDFVDIILETTDSILEESKSGNAYFYEDEETISPVILKVIQKDPTKVFTDLNEGFSFYFTKYPSGQEKEGPIKKRIESQKRSIEEFLSKSDKLKEQGKKLISDLKRYQKLLDDLNKMISTGEIKAGDVYDGFTIQKIDYEKKRVEISVDGDLMQLYLGKTAGDNASELFNYSKELKEKARGAEAALVESTRLFENSNVTESKRKRQKNWFEVYHWFFTSSGNLVMAGRDRKTNENLVKKHMTHSDIYVHADLYGAPSTLIKFPSKDSQPLEDIREACNFSVAFSRAWPAGIASGSAYWVYPEQVSKTPESGEYVSKGAWIIRGKRNYIFDLPMKLEIGWHMLNDTRILMIAPINTKRNCETKLVRIEPGEEKRSRAAKKIASLLDADPEEVEGILPPGGFRISEQ
jgi:predicted ribosome quality control (RQC) complex YloA/Tae2 family protein